MNVKFPIPLLVFCKIETVLFDPLPVPKLVTTRSGLPSALRSPSATPTGPGPTVGVRTGTSEIFPGVLVFRKTEIVLPPPPP